MASDVREAIQSFSQGRAARYPVNPDTFERADEANPAGPRGAKAPISLVIVGDVMLDGLPGEAIAVGGDPFAHLSSLLEGADIVVGNLECPVTTRGEKVEKVYNFRAHPRVVPVLARYFDAVSLANNHSGDFGREALVDTLDWLDRGKVGRFGAGRDLHEAHAPLVIERGGVRVAFLGYDEFHPRSFAAGPRRPGVAWSMGREDRVLDDIARAKSAYRADVVIPFLHWGWEDEPEPNDRQRWLSRALIDAGADMVVGAYPHVTQGTETYKGRLIAYSLGNFVFEEYEGRPGWALRLTLDREGISAWEIVVIRTDAQGFPRPDPQAQAPSGCLRPPMTGGKQ